MNKIPRRIITGIQNGKSTVIEDLRTYSFSHRFHKFTEIKLPEIICVICEKINYLYEAAISRSFCFIFSGLNTPS